MNEYSEKLKDPRWQKKRLEILQRDNFTCQLCKDKETTLHVHHKEYVKNCEPWNYPDDNFVTYCKHCHLLVEGYNYDPRFPNKKVIFLRVIKTQKDASDEFVILISKNIVLEDEPFISIDRYYRGQIEHILLLTDGMLDIMKEKLEGIKSKYAEKLLTDGPTA